MQLIDLYILYALSTALIQVSSHFECIQTNLLPLWELPKMKGLVQAMSLCFQSPQSSPDESCFLYPCASYLALVDQWRRWLVSLVCASIIAVDVVYCGFHFSVHLIWLCSKLISKRHSFVQFVYLGLVGSFPFNSFLAGFLSSIGTAVLAGKPYRRIVVLMALSNFQNLYFSHLRMQLVKASLNFLF